MNKRKKEKKEEREKEREREEEEREHIGFKLDMMWTQGDSGAEF